MEYSVNMEALRAIGQFSPLAHSTPKHSPCPSPQSSVSSATYSYDSSGQSRTRSSCPTSDYTRGSSGQSHTRSSCPSPTATYYSSDQSRSQSSCCSPTPTYYSSDQSHSQSSCRSPTPTYYSSDQSRTRSSCPTPTASYQSSSQHTRTPSRCPSPDYWSPHAGQTPKPWASPDSHHTKRKCAPSPHRGGGSGPQMVRGREHCGSGGRSWDPQPLRLCGPTPSPQDCGGGCDDSWAPQVIAPSRQHCGGGRSGSGWSPQKLQCPSGGGGGSWSPQMMRSPSPHAPSPQRGHHSAPRTRTCSPGCPAGRPQTTPSRGYWSPQAGQTPKPWESPCG